MKLPIKRALLSGIVIPGLGQFKNGDKLKGAIYLLASLLVVAGFLYKIAFIFSDYFQAMASFADPAFNASPNIQISVFFKNLMRTFLVWGAAGFLVWGASAADAYYSAKRKFGNIEENDLKDSAQRSRFTPGSNHQ